MYSFAGTALQVRYLYRVFVSTIESLIHQVNSWKVAMRRFCLLVVHQTFGNAHCTRYFAF